MTSFNLFNVCVIGEVQIDVWNQASFNTTLLESALDLTPNDVRRACFDFIFVSTPVEWRADGSFCDLQLRRDTDYIRACGYEGDIVITSITPIGTCERLGCHYLPMVRWHVEEQEGHVFFGCNTRALIDADTIRYLLQAMFHTTRISLRKIFDVEMRSLIQLCQAHINKSFQHEISHFCSKNNINSPFIPPKYSPEITPVLVYMVRQMEDIKLDCPILYSCLFRQHYIDIRI